MEEIEKVKKAQKGCKKTLRSIAEAYRVTITSVAVAKFKKWHISVINSEDIKLFVLGHLPEWIMTIPTNTEYQVYTLLHNKMQFALNNELRKYKRNKMRVSSSIDFNMASVFLNDSKTEIKKDFMVEELLSNRTLTKLEQSVVRDIIMDGATYEEAAKAQNVKEKAAKNAYFRAIKKLKIVYKNKFYSL